MDKEKLEKAAEEARITTAISARSDWHHSLDDVHLDVSFDELVESAFIKGAHWLLSQPLSERLTEGEKRMLRCHYHTEECVVKDHRKRTGDKAVAKAVARIKLYEQIFGSELFTNKTEK